ncbi:MAG: AraC family transcriptional regulator [Deltaproteobacteria bacterium]|nr:AraC family transcriptional regulator [Deltaproteobacteria bacterium]
MDNLNKSIQEIARQIGYDDVFYFSRLFKKYKGISPSVIRKPC